MDEKFEAKGVFGEYVLRTNTGDIIPIGFIPELKYNYSGGPSIPVAKYVSEDCSGFTCSLTANRYTIFTLLLGHKRLVRRAIRHYEKLRRYEVKFGIIYKNKILYAEYLARHGSNNKKVVQKGEEDDG